MLKLLRLDGCIVTADALHCRRDTAQAILDTGADYALALKSNQPKLLARAKALIEAAGQDQAAPRICQYDSNCNLILKATFLQVSVSLSWMVV